MISCGPLEIEAGLRTFATICLKLHNAPVGVALQRIIVAEASHRPEFGELLYRSSVQAAVERLVDYLRLQQEKQNRLLDLGAFNQGLRWHTVLYLQVKPIDSGAMDAERDVRLPCRTGAFG